MSRSVGSHEYKKARKRPVRGTVLILLGARFLFDGLGYDLPRLGALWPAFPLLSGALSLFAFATREKKDPSLVFSGVSGVLLGLFFFCFTLDFFD